MQTAKYATGEPALAPHVSPPAGGAVTLNDIRVARVEDAPRLKHIAETAYAKYVPRMTKPPSPFFYDYAKIIAAGNTYVIEHRGEVIAMVTLTSQPDHFLLQNLAVLPDRQRHGVGRLFLAFAENEARTRGFREIRLWTNEKMTENVPYYTALGYEVTHAATVDGYSRIFMRKAIPAG